MGERLELARQINETIARDAFAKSPHPGVERALTFMRQNVNEPIVLHDLADAAYLSPFHLTRLFRVATGASPGAFLAALKLADAKRLLLTTDMPVAEVCFAVGYRALGTFTSRFTRLVGVPPRQLRRLPDLIAATQFAGRGLPPTSAAWRQSREYIVGRVDGPAAASSSLRARSCGPKSRLLSPACSGGMTSSTGTRSPTAARPMGLSASTMSCGTPTRRPAPRLAPWAPATSQGIR
jgi:AraC-like DNA-binding protein